MYTLGTASKATGKSKSTILKAISSGRISAVKDDLGQWEIDPSELHRVYRPVSVNRSPEHLIERQDTPREPPDLSRENEILRGEVEDLRRRLDEETAERRKLTYMLMEPRKRNLWQWLTRSSAKGG